MIMIMITHVVRYKEGSQLCVLRVNQTLNSVRDWIIGMKYVEKHSTRGKLEIISKTFDSSDCEEHS